MESDWIWAILPWVILLAFVWWYLMRPQQIKQQERQEMLDSLQAGQQIVTLGGLHGTIIRVRDNSLQVQVADGVEVTVSRTGVSHLVGRADDEA